MTNTDGARWEYLKRTGRTYLREVGLFDDHDRGLAHRNDTRAIKCTLQAVTYLSLSLAHDLGLIDVRCGSSRRNKGKPLHIYGNDHFSFIQITALSCVPPRGPTTTTCYTEYSRAVQLTLSSENCFGLTL